VVTAVIRLQFDRTTTT